MADTSETGPKFDDARAVDIYRAVIEERDHARTNKAREEFNTIAMRLRETWKKWHGEDSLHETAFGTSFAGDHET